MLHRHHQGFTLIEVAVAVAILVMTFGGVMALIISGKESKVSGRNNMIASYLAKEGISLVNFARNQNYHNSQPAFASLYDENNPYYFLIDYEGMSSITEAASSDVKKAEPLNLYNSYYGYSAEPTAVPTSFRRLITTIYHGDATPPYLDVKVEVYWQEDTKRNTVTLSEELTDWR